MAATYGEVLVFYLPICFFYHLANNNIYNNNIITGNIIFCEDYFQKANEIMF